MSNITFNEKQQQTIAKINEFISQDTNHIFYLFGYAGTGKTFLMSRIINQILINDKMDHVFICSPTHQALKVIESDIKKDLTPTDQTTRMLKISFMTIHKLLDFKPIIMTEDGSKVFKSTKESNFLKRMENKLIIIDECSMISKDMLFELKKYMELYPIKLIFMGDEMQLPPVKEKVSLVFKNVPEKYYYQILLDEIMRTNSPDIKDVCTTIRKWNYTDSLAKLLLPIHNRKRKNKTFKLFHNKTDYAKTSWFKFFVDNLTQGNIPIILTWKNSTAHNYNTIVRKFVHKTENINNYVVGDYAIFSNFYSSPEDGGGFYTSDMIKILNITTDERELFNWTSILVDGPKSPIEKAFNMIVKKISKCRNKFLVDSFTVEKINKDSSLIIQDKTYLVQSIHRDCLEDYQIMLDIVKEHIEFFFKKFKTEKTTTKLWDIYHKKLKEPYAEINFGYSITVHKAQGSTFNTVLVDTSDICENTETDEIKKSLYTAAGRSSKFLGFLLK